MLIPAGSQFAVSRLAAAGMNQNRVIGSRNAVIIRTYAADAAQVRDIVQIAEHCNHAGDTAFSLDLIDPGGLAGADLRLGIDDVIHHNRIRAKRGRLVNGKSREHVIIGGNIFFLSLTGCRSDTGFFLAVV